MINRTATLVALFFFSLATRALAEPPATTAATIATPIHQLRIYELNPQKRDVFHARFRDHASRIMNRHGFKILAMWETASDSGPEFAYLLEWRDETAMKSAWAAFMADQEWSDIKAATRAREGSIMGGIEDRVLRLTPYSPNLGR